MKHITWHFRRNMKRKHGSRKAGSHPSLVIGETDDGSSFYNLGLTKSKKRGHHNNIPIHNPKNWEETSYLRDDLQIDSKDRLSVVLKDYNLNPNDIEKIWKIIKKRIPTRR